jgi:hypothetical protein
VRQRSCNAAIIRLNDVQALAFDVVGVHEKNVLMEFEELRIKVYGMFRFILVEIEGSSRVSPWLKSIY